jgi:serine protease Do
VAAGVLGGAGATFVSGQHAHAALPAITSPAVTAPTNAVGAPDFSQIAERYGASVVNISVSGMKHVGNDEEAPTLQRGMPPGVDPNDPFFEFFRHFQGPNGGAQGPQDVPVRGQGSGFIVSADGLILTNAHVVRDAKDVTVKLTDRREFQAKVLGSDPKTDVAVLKIDAKNLPVVPMGSSRDLKVGEWVLAIGSPFGFENSVSAGVVSAKGRSLPDDSFVPFIQTDVAVNPGNSGGPLFNARGEVIGINSQIYSRTGGYQGLSFAIPIDLATKVKEQIVATGKASHARLGVAIQDVNQTFADSFKLDKPEGALVSKVDKGSAAAAAGLKAGDVIRKVDGQPIVAAGDLSALIGQSTPGKKVNIEVWRQGKSEMLSARLGDASDKQSAVAKADESVGKGKLGLALRPLQPQEKREAGIEGGLVVESAGGPAALAGVQPGDVLMAINGKPVTSVEQVREAVARSDRSVALLIQRDGNQIFVPVKIG